MLELAVLSAAFAMGAAIPERHACGPCSPPLSWSEVPAGDWVHWVVFNLAPDVRELPESVARDGALPGGAIQGMNDYDRNGYDGPCPPPGRLHHYHFKVFALDARLALGVSARKADLLQAMRGHVLAQGELVGTYARKSR